MALRVGRWSGPHQHRLQFGLRAGSPIDDGARHEPCAATPVNGASKSGSTSVSNGDCPIAIAGGDGNGES